ncbi:MAG: YheC/YheD family endospore coat-associated protein [Tumebacillaceae bacterium]
MPLIGFLHYRSDPRRVRKAYAFAAVAQAEGIDLMYMTPGRVDVAAEKVLGLVLENGQWVEKTLPLPDVIYNEGMSNSDRSNEVVDWLRERIPFTSHSIGDKVTVYEKVQKGNQYTQYLIPYQEVRRASQVLRFVDKNPKTILKPVWGHQGIGVVYIEKRASGYLVLEKDRSVVYDEQELTEFVTQRLNEVVHVVQKFIICRTKTGAPYDFRLHVQKNGDGQWVITTIYPRVAPSGSLIANISNGGYTNTFQAFLMQEFGDQYFNVKRMLERFALVFAAHMDEVYGESFDELGIDIGLDEDQKIWLFEVNWKPGVPITFYLELDVVQNAVLYAHYLAMQNALDK